MDIAKLWLCGQITTWLIIMNCHIFIKMGWRGKGRHLILHDWVGIGGAVGIILIPSCKQNCLEYLNTFTRVVCFVCVLLYAPSFLFVHSFATLATGWKYSPHPASRGRQRFTLSYTECIDKISFKQNYRKVQSGPLDCIRFQTCILFHSIHSYSSFQRRFPSYQDDP